MKFCGWIKANKEDYLVLRHLGVEGEMRYRHQPNKPVWTEHRKMLGLWWLAKKGPTFKEDCGYDGVFEYCTIPDMDCMLRMGREWPGFMPGVFTAIDESGIQLPREEQAAWRIK